MLWYGFVLLTVLGFLFSFAFVVWPRWPGKAGERQVRTEGTMTDAELAVRPEVLEQLRGPVATLLGGALALVLLAQLVYAATYPTVPMLLYPVILLGLLTFLLAGHSVLRGERSFWFSRPVRWLESYLGLQPAQLVLLFLAPWFAFLTRLAAGDGLQAAQPFVATLSWSLALAALVTGSYRRQGSRAAPASRRELLLVAALFLLALALRGVGLEHLPDTLSGDEASAGLVAAQFREGQADNLFGLGWFSFPSLFFAVQSSGIWLLGQTAAGLRLTSALAGALTVVGVYWLARSLYGRLAALLAALYLLAFHFHIHFSRIGLQNIWDSLFLAWVLWGVWDGWKEDRRTSFIVAGLALGLGQYFYVSMRLVPLLLLLWAAAAFVLRREQFRARLPGLLLTAFIAAVIVLPLAVLFARHPDEFSAPMNRVTIFNGWLESQVAGSGEPAAVVILRQMRDTALGFAYLPLRHWYNPGVPLLLATPAGFFLAGLLWIVYRFDLRSLLLLLPLLGLILLGGLSQDAPASQRFVLATPAVAVLVALPLAKGAEWLRLFWPRRRAFIIGLVVGIMLLLMAGDLHYYFFEVYDEYVLGGYNTQTATAVARYLQAQDDPEQRVEFFGFPRMGYYSLSTIPYLAPEMEGHDVDNPLMAPPSEPLAEPTIFIFLPERLEEAQYVREAYPGGQYKEFEFPGRTPPTVLFAAYEVRP